MGWVVSSWRTERLAALLDARAHDYARAIVVAAERDARRIARTSARELADATAYLEELERLGEEALAAVRARRSTLKDGERAPVEPVEPPEKIRIAPAPHARRASMRDSPLGELFRATAPLPAGRALD